VSPHLFSEEEKEEGEKKKNSQSQGKARETNGYSFGKII
jgi:hypothetical protein